MKILLSFSVTPETYGMTMLWCSLFFSSPPTVLLLFQDLAAAFTKEAVMALSVSFGCLPSFSWAWALVGILSARWCRALITPSLCSSGGESQRVSTGLCVWVYCVLYVEALVLFNVTGTVLKGQTVISDVHIVNLMLLFIELMCSVQAFISCVLILMNLLNLDNDTTDVKYMGPTSKLELKKPLGWAAKGLQVYFQLPSIQPSFDTANLDDWESSKTYFFPVNFIRNYWENIVQLQSTRNCCESVNMKLFPTHYISICYSNIIEKLWLANWHVNTKIMSYGSAKVMFPVN